jgi:ribonuclease J
LVVVTPYGGVNEIGGNKILVENDGARIFLDFGISFSKTGQYYEEFLRPRANNFLRDLLTMGVVPKLDGIYRQDMVCVQGIEGKIPQRARKHTPLYRADVKSYDDYVKENGHPFVDGVVLSHGHADHFQHISLLGCGIPIYCAPMTAVILQAVSDISKGGIEQEFLEYKERELSTRGDKATFPGEPTIDKSDCKFRPINKGHEFKMDSMNIKLLPIDHSVQGACFTLIEANSGNTLAYTGDIRFHGRYRNLTRKAVEELNKRDIDLLITEGTRIDEDVSHDELRVEEDIVKAFKSIKGLAVVGFGWKDVTRYETMVNVAQRLDRTLVISPKLAYLLHLLKEQKLLEISTPEDSDLVSVYLPRKDSMLYSKSDYSHTKHALGYSVEWNKGEKIRSEHFENGVRAYDLSENPSRYILHLDFYEFNELVDISPPEGSAYISASTEPFSEEMEIDERRLNNWLRHFKLLGDGENVTHIHASGHAGGSELIEMIEEIHPQVVIPVHVEEKNLHIFRKRLDPSIEVVLPEVGKPIRF